MTSNSKTSNSKTSHFKPASSLLTLGALASLILLSGCSLLSGKADVKEGADIDNPIAAIQKIATLAGEAENWQKELENLEPVDPLPFQDLIATLPEPPADWEADDATGSINSMGEFSLSEAGRSYRNGDKRIQLKVMDWAHNQAMYLPFMMAAQFSQDSTEGYNKGIEIDGAPGREEFTYATNQGNLQLLHGKRFHISVEGDGIEPEELHDWLAKVELQELPQGE